MGVLGDVLIVFYEATLPLNLEGRKPTQLERNRNFFLQRFFLFDENGPKIPLLLFVAFFFRMYCKVPLYNFYVAICICLQQCNT